MNQEQTIEQRAYPFYGYAPGNYLNTCSCCKKSMYNVDKRCFVCLECAINFSKNENEELREALVNLVIRIESNAITKDIDWYKKEKRAAKQLLTNKPNNNG